MRKSCLVAAPLASYALALLCACSNVSLESPTRASFLYVASSQVPTHAEHNLYGYLVAPDGSLTPIHGASVINANAVSLVGFGSTLFTSDGFSISAYTVNHDGSLQLKRTTPVGVDESPYGSQGPNLLYLDARNQTLYSWDYEAVDASQFFSYSFDPSTGAVTQSGSALSGFPDGYRDSTLAFSPDDRYAVSRILLWKSDTLVTYERALDGTLRLLPTVAPLPPGAGMTFAPLGAAADNAYHFLVPGQYFVSWYSGQNTPWQIAIYTMDSSGNLTTQSTAQNMPTPPSLGPQREPIGYAFSPDSLYFAVADSLGIDVYAWNTASATLSYLTSITPSRSCPPNQSCMYFHSFAWDINDHLIALWGTYGDDGEIQVYTVTSSGITPASGSPHPLPAADFLTIVNAPTPRL